MAETNLQSAIDLLSDYLQHMRQRGEWSLDGKKLDDALELLLQTVSSNESLIKDQTMMKLDPPIKVYHIINPNRPDLRGLEVGFDVNNNVGLRCIADPNLGFILTKESAITLSQLITLVLGDGTSFNLVLLDVGV